MPQAAVAEVVSLPGAATPVPAWQLALSRLDTSRAAGAQTTVAVIDGRLGPDGGLLGGRIATRLDAVRSLGPRRAVETEHALIVSGVLAGQETGACPGCRVIAIGVMEKTPLGTAADQRTIALALRRARLAGARVVNMSLSAFACTPQLRREVARSVAAGVVVVAAAGNDPGQSRLSCPASLPDVVSVGALTHQNQALRLTYAGQSLAPTVWALGEWVLAGHDQTGRALWGTGSSFAAPQVSGALATLVADPAWRPVNRTGVRRVISRLLATSRPLADGRLMLDAHALLQGAGPPFAFTDAFGNMVVDNRDGSPAQLCAADGESFQIRSAGTLSGAPASYRDPDGAPGPAVNGSWTRVRSVELPAGGLYSLALERIADQGRSLELREAGACG